MRDACQGVQDLLLRRGTPSGISTNANGRRDSDASLRPPGEDGAVRGASSFIHQPHLVVVTEQRLPIKFAISLGFRGDSLRGRSLAHCSGRFVDCGINRVPGLSRLVNVRYQRASADDHQGRGGGGGGNQRCGLGVDPPMVRSAAYQPDWTPRPRIDLNNANPGSCQTDVP